MALSFIGKPISLISHSDVRYRGILAGIDPAASTIQLSNVYSMGTESRRPPAEFIPPVQEPYQYIIFRASEVKDLAVDEPVPRRSVHDDPAVLGASAPLTSAPYSPYVTPPQAVAPPPPVPQPQPVPQQYNRTPQQSAITTPQPVQQQPVVSTQGQVPIGPVVSAQPQIQGRQQGQNRRNNNSVHSAAVSLETVERAIGDLRVSNAAAVSAAGANGRGGRRGRGQHRAGENIVPTEIKVPSTDFDFESSNAKFDKAALAAASSKANAANGTTPEGESANGSEGGNESGDKEAKDKEKSPVAYNPSKSFFDSLSSSTHPSISAGNEGRGGRGRRGGASGRNRREEERERNVATFGEPGGVGLMGPGAYVGGWGGYGRRGGRPRRGGAGNGAAAQTSQAVPARG
ncbi:hypothetical protein AX17_003948 [Amanita inopinata Kibby_2008]|nr:hypothetical protein AX17_003948 [Amanita inopinata Kibby_2008]